VAATFRNQAESSDFGSEVWALSDGNIPGRNPRTLSPAAPGHLSLAQLSYVCMARSNPLHILMKHNLVCFFSRQPHALSASPFLLCPLLQPTSVHCTYSREFT
jgi:hypothetical protein